MDLQLAGKSALVSGSTSGIGLAIAISLAEEGAAVIINGRTEQRVNEALVQIRGAVPNANVTGMATDLGTADGARAVIDRYPGVDILVNNLGFYETMPFEKIDDAAWTRIFEVNVLSGVRLSRHYLPIMKQKNWGRIVFISSESGVQTPAEMVHYGVTKTAQIALARGLAETTAGTAVTVNSILVGPTSSEGVAEFVKGVAKSRGVDASVVEKEFFQNVRPSSLLRRFQTPEEVAAMVAFVCSPKSSGTNGAALRSDGGVIRTIL
jgi:NAD(P)-dependent dehydrogenase (short-subunit alcohol dehydrogenase family)